MVNFININKNLNKEVIVMEEINLDVEIEQIEIDETIDLLLSCCGCSDELDVDVLVN